MGDEWFYEQGARRRSGTNKLSALLIILVIVNAAVLGFFVLDFSLQTSKLSRDVELLQFKLSSASSEISSLKDEIRMLRLGNSTASLGLTQIYNQTRRSVVLIRIQTVLGSAQGSGFVYDTMGRIITNNHVVEGSTKIEVTFIDGTIVPATLVGRDPYSDLAVIDVDIDPSFLIPVRLGNSSDLLVGEQVIAIGNPFGLADTMTSGIISAVSRQMDAPSGYTIVDVIQTDAAINPGNSGGPLLNMRGEVVGMNTAIISETRQFSGIGFAIPSDTIRREVPSLIEKGTYQHPYLGITGMDVTPAIAELMGLDKGTRGALVVSVVEGGPAYKTGLKGGTTEATIEGTQVRIGGDVVVGVEGKTVQTLYDLIVYLERYHKPGETVDLTILRDKSVTEAKLTLGVRPQPT